MRLHGWDDDFADRAIAGYRLFMTLKAQLGDWNATAISPPIIVEQVWQQHILDVDHYIFACDEYCGHRIGHNPDDTLDEENLAERVKAAKIAYRTLNGRDMDEEIWSFDTDNSNSTTNDNNSNNNRNNLEERPSASKRARLEMPSLPTNATRPGGHPITIRVGSYGGTGAYNDTYFKIKPDTKMQKVFDRFALHWGMAADDFSFIFGKRAVLPQHDAIQLGLQDADIIYATTSSAILEE
jgi:hypothetical protein